ncbi:PREDICTED: protein SET DOMAIN GROUP 40 isoform X2 [Theobroma cacao]|uniref:Protein SET DOMAIN GROUP 40 isoform X2 n=1 Tax=Theobroma cacao TaxID=3641 RepID=A0AB32W8G9_THECC|nr:PREDICTED: protein SET DOMAIN GROUP 40 isoform X2 [Theobroma cacao]
MNPSGSEAKGKATNTQSQEEGEEEERGSLDSFLKWAAGLGVSDSPNPDSCSCLGHSLGVSYFPDAGGRGLGAVRDITRGELLLKVPKSALITTHSLLNDERLSTALKAYPSLSPAQVDYAIWAAQKALSKAEYEWKEATPLMKELKLKPQFLTFRAWIWATGTISSRTLHIPWDEAGCLCPVGDLFNYAAPGEDLNGFDNVDNLQNGYALDDLDTQHSQRLTDGAFEEDAAAYCFYAKTNYKKGEQVLLSYGTYTNLELLEYYGFLLEDNPNEKVFIPLEPDIHSSSSWPKDSLYIHQNGRPSFALMAALRVWATPPYQRKSIRHRAYSGSQLSQDNEISVMTWIAKKCHATLKAMPTSIEDDNLLLSFTDKIQEFDNLWEWGKVMPAFGGEFCNLLQATNLKRNDESFASRRAKMLIDRWKLAVHWRLIYKKVLVDCISYCTDTINSLSSKNDIIL